MGNSGDGDGKVEGKISKGTVANLTMRGCCCRLPAVEGPLGQQSQSHGVGDAKVGADEGRGQFIGTGDPHAEGQDVRARWQRVGGGRWGGYGGRGRGGALLAGNGRFGISFPNAHTRAQVGAEIGHQTTSTHHARFRWIQRFHHAGDAEHEARYLLLFGIVVVVRFMGKLER